MPSPRFAVVDGQVVHATQEQARAAQPKVYLGGYRGYDGTPLEGADKAFIGAKMNATVAAVRTAFRVAHGKVAITPNILLGAVASVLTLGLSQIGFPSSPAEVKRNVDGGLKTLERAYDTQVVAGMERVYSGALDPARWFEMNRIFVEGIKSVLDELDESNTANSLSSFFSDMMNDVAAFLAKFKAGVERTLDYMPLIVGVVGVVAAYTLITQLTAPVRALAPERKRLNGYRAPRSLKSQNRRRA